MPEKYTTPFIEVKPPIRRLFSKSGRKVIRSDASKVLPLQQQIVLVRRRRQEVESALGQKSFNDAAGLPINSSMTMPFTEILRDISHNIAKMDQNLYSTKASLQEISRSGSKSGEFVSLL